MPRFADLPDDFSCPHRHGCPYLEGLSTQWVWEECNAAQFFVEADARR